MPWESGVQFVAVIISFAVFSILLGLTRPRFFWRNRLVESWRWAFGDRGVVIIYVALGVSVIAFQLAAALGLA